jgi:hypothetical protein
MNSDEHSNHPTPQTKDANHIIPKSTVAKTYFGGLLLALLITWGFGGFDAEVLRFTYMFPIGCLLFIESRATLYLGYAIYIAIFICAFIFRKKWSFIQLLVVYILLLCLNITGCAVILNINIS